MGMVWKVEVSDLPGHLPHIRHAPSSLYVRTATEDTFQELMHRPKVAIVGTRRSTAYGQQVTADFAGTLAAYGVVIISGLALGIDAIAHRTALAAQGLTMAVLPGPVEDIYPRSHYSLAQRILQNDGALISEYPAGTTPFKTNFVARNRIVAGLADALLITEAADNSGTMHTARFAMEQGIPVLAIPGNITSPTSAGTNNLVKTDAIAVTSASDVLFALGLTTAPEATSKKIRLTSTNPQEQRILDLLEQGITDGNELLQRSQLEVETFNHHLTMLEITAKIRALGANHWGLA
jgi:DNA processing protein